MAVLGTRDLWTMDDETYDAFRNHLFQADCAKFYVDHDLLNEIALVIGIALRPCLDGNMKKSVTEHRIRDAAFAAIRKVKEHSAT